LDEEGPGFYVEGDFTGPRSKGETRNAHDVPQIHAVLKRGKRLPQLVFLQVNLDFPRQVLKMGENRFAHIATGHHPSRHRDRLFRMPPGRERRILGKNAIACTAPSNRAGNGLTPALAKDVSLVRR
jgi:hypothetical protein